MRASQTASPIRERQRSEAGEPERRLRPGQRGKDDEADARQSAERQAPERRLVEREGKSGDRKPGKAGKPDRDDRRRAGRKAAQNEGDRRRKREGRQDGDPPHRAKGGRRKRALVDDGHR